MTITLDLAPEVEARLKETAARSGLSPEEYLERSLERLLPADLTNGQAEAKPRTGAELLAYWERLACLGVYADRPDSPEFGRQLREQEEKHRAGIWRRS